MKPVVTFVRKSLQSCHGVAASVSSAPATLCVAILLFPQVSLGQEFRSTTAIQSASQLVTVDLTNVSEYDHASITLHNSAGTPVSIPQVSNVNSFLPLSRSTILSQLPDTGTDEGNAIEAWDFVLSRGFHLCSSGAKQDNYFNLDVISFFGAYGFGCCDQSAQVLIWIWRQMGYEARLALMPFDTIPEIWYGNAWHMLDPDHEVFYRKDDGTIASVEEIVADVSLVARTADSNGNDPVGWPAAQMAQLYAENGPALRYNTGVGSAILPSSYILLRPHESLTLQSENTEDFVHFGWPGPGYHAPPMTSVSSGQFDWMLSFGDPSWQAQTFSLDAVDVVADPYGKKWLVNTTSNVGYVVYQQGSPFPVSSLVISAQLGLASGASLRASFFDGVSWSDPVVFEPGTGVSSFDASADLSELTRGYYSYYLRIELVGDVRVHKLRIVSAVQTARDLLPSLDAGSVNHLRYSDESAQSQARSTKVTVAVPSGKPLIRGIRAESLVPESPWYSLARDYGAANLVDSDPDSLAYPGSTHLDYAIQLKSTYEVSGISIDWNYFGTQSQYVNGWQVFGRRGNQSWQLLATGEFPEVPTLEVRLNSMVSEIRIVADSNNWIGIYEVRVFGNAVAPFVPSILSTAHSNVREDPLYSLAQDHGASKLVDGDTATLAYPASTRLDYEIALFGLDRVSCAKITWGQFGTNPIYIQSWTLLGRNGPGQPWITLAQGSYPNTSETALNLDFIGTDLRVIASSSNWIGIYEVQVCGDGTAPYLPSTVLRAHSNVHEDPLYSLARNYGASNLIDGNRATLAYPGSTQLDYEISLSVPAPVSSVKIIWGYFGTNPVYVQSWSLLGRNGAGQPWITLAQGGFPNSSQISFSLDFFGTDLRIIASSGNWIGIYELQISGSASPQKLALVPSANMMEVDSSTFGPAANLIDGSLSTSAYPGSGSLDYTLDPGQEAYIDSLTITWGHFGTDVDGAHVESWRVLALALDGLTWEVIARGLYPDSAETIVPVRNSYRELRVAAESRNWIGIFEVQALGNVFSSALAVP